MSRIKRFLKWIAIILLSVVSIAILVVAFLNWRASREVAARLAPLREAEKPLSIIDLQPSPVDDAENAAKAIEPFEELCRELEAQLAKATFKKNSDEEFEAALIEVARTIVEDHPDFIPNLRAAIALPEFQPEYQFTLSPTPFMENVLEQTRSVRMVARVLHGHGLMSLEDGNTDEAIVNVIAILQWSHHIAKQPLLVSYLVSAAVRGEAMDLAAGCLFAGDASVQKRTRLLNMIEGSDLQTQFERANETERAFGISSFDSFPLSRFKFMLGELSAYLDIVAEFESIAEKRTGMAPKLPQSKSIFAGSVWPAFETGLAALRRSQAKSRAIRILAAWQDQGSDITANIDDLELTASIKTDPFDGSQMKLKLTSGTVVIYSVGKNLSDDGGKLEGELDVGVGR